MTGPSTPGPRSIWPPAPTSAPKGSAGATPPFPRAAATTIWQAVDVFFSSRFNRDLANANVVTLGNFFAEFPGLFDWATPDGGCIGFPRYLGEDGVESFCTRLVEESGVFLAPASIYRSDLGETPDDRFRIGYGRANIEEGLDAMRAWLLRNAA